MLALLIKAILQGGSAAQSCSHFPVWQSGLHRRQRDAMLAGSGCCRGVQANGPCEAYPRFTIREGLFALMLFISKCVRYTGAKWFTAIVISQSSSEKSSGGRNTPATASQP